MSLSSGQTANTIQYTAPASVNLPSEYDFVEVDTAVPNSSTTITLGNIKNSGFLGSAKRFTVSDIGGNASNSPIRIQGSLGDSINGAAYLDITNNFGSVVLQPVSNTQWSATGNGATPPAPPPSIPTLQQVLNFNRKLVNG